MSARPGRISQVIDVDLPQPRTVETRELERYFELVTAVREALRQHEGDPAPDEAGAARIRAEGLGLTALAGLRGSAPPRWLPAARRVRRRGRPVGDVLAVFDVKSFLFPRPTRDRRALVDAVADPRRRAWSSRARRRSAGSPSACASGPWPASRRRAGRRPGRSSSRSRSAASSIPIIAFAPITINWFGSESLLPRITIVALMVFFPVMVNTVRGLTKVDPAALELMRSYARRRHPDAAQAAHPERDAVLVHRAADRDDAERHRRGGRRVLRRAAVLARDLHHATRRASSGTRTAWAAIVLACAPRDRLYLAAVVPSGS